MMVHYFYNRFRYGKQTFTKFTSRGRLTVHVVMLSVDGGENDDVRRTDRQTDGVAVTTECT